MASTIRGFSINEPNMHYTDSGKAVAEFNLAKKPLQELTPEEGISLTTTITVWEALAEQISQVLQVGNELFVSGYVKERTNTDGNVESNYTANKVWLINPNEQFVDIMTIPPPEEAFENEIEQQQQEPTLESMFNYIPEWSVDNFSMAQERHAEVVANIEKLHTEAIAIFGEWWTTGKQELLEQAHKKLEEACIWNFEITTDLKNEALINCISERASFLFELVASQLDYRPKAKESK